MTLRPPQTQPQQPGIESAMTPRPVSEGNHLKPAGRLLGKVALITGGDSGIGRAVAIAFAREGANIALNYLNEHTDAIETRTRVETLGRSCLLLPGDVGDSRECEKFVTATLAKYEGIDVVVNNAAEQHPQASLADITDAQLERTFRTNIFAHFYLTRAALPYLKKGATVINTTSVTAYRGSSHLLDYSATKGAIVAFTRSLALALVEKGIRVNAVAPGPIWTPLIPATFSKEKVASFGSDVPMKRAGEPEEVAPCYVFLASEEASYITGQVLHPNGGEIING
ncbi:SDR family oxidoreductase [Opitutus terrae]|uniref:Short-chain dehydrogenase/reductase SDR n=1 Tax=Opitutus terrae (strain DSM 11246 / JCM 15787 / PB90-1) TaxID=452637 RepID=B1ZWK9_OPITP|nr:SDR family oxidoreductase [Opitutus terrae]ACB73333.1 short-chain dehydrogenase/reductase SDR [Opitutus terrae PB90-1]